MSRTVFSQPGDAGAEAMAASAMAAADQAVTQANGLQQTANSYQSAVQASIADRQALHAEDTTLHQRDVELAALITQQATAISALAASVAGLQQQIAAIPAGPKGDPGSKGDPGAPGSNASATITDLAEGKLAVLLALNLSVDVAISWNITFPSPAYTVRLLHGPGSVGAGLALKSKSTTGCVVTITAAVALAANSVFYAYATS